MRLPLWRRKQDDDLRDEIRNHFAMSVRDRMERGESRAQAEAAARREFGNTLLVSEVTREMWGWASLERLWQDLRYGARLLRRSPGFSVVAVLTLALGIGANTALFSVVNAVLLRPLPYPEPQQLVALHMSKPNFQSGAISFPNFQDWQAQNRSFTAMALSRSSAASLIGNGETEYMRINYVTADFFRVLGVEPVAGRNFAPGEDRIGGPAIVQISEGFWMRKFGSQPVLGNAINLSGKSYTIVGIVPATFSLQLLNFQPTDVYLPMGQWDAPGLKVRGAALGLHGIGRIKPNLSLAQARADMEAVSLHLAEAFPNTNRDNKANLIPLGESIIGQARPVLLLLLGAVGFVLLIACVNVASILLARSEARAREFAVRAALGAGRLRMLRQLLTESVLLAAIGGTLGLLISAWGTRAALGLLPSGLPRMQQVHVDLRVLAFSAGISLVAGILFGLAPALRMIRPNLQAGLQAGGRSSTGRTHAPQSVLVVVEVALALVLLVGAGLMLRSLAQLWRVDPGFNPHNLAIFSVRLAPSLDNATPEATRAILRDAYHALESTPGVEKVSLRDGTIPMRSDNELLFWMAGQPQPRTDAEKNWALTYQVQPSYLAMMQIPLIRGRFFGPQDTEKTPRVVVIDDVFASTFFPNQDAIGKRIQYGENGGRIVEAQIVGIVGHVRHWGLDLDDANPLRAQVYEDFNQAPDDNIGGSFGVTLRASGTPLALIPTITRRLQQLSGENAVFNPMSFDSIIAASLATRRFSMILLSLFAGVSLLLAAIGIYGVVSYVVVQRSPEIGLRMALGAQRRDVLRMVMMQGGRMALLGIVIGVLAALALTRLMTGMLYGVKATDPITFALVAALLCAIALAACFIPARRAMLVDPMTALRYE